MWLESGNDDYRMVRAKTKENVNLDPDYVRSLEETYTGAFARQELEGSFVTLEGLIYEMFSREVHVKEPPPRFDRVIAGVDWGFTNPAAILPLGQDGDNNAWALDEFYARRMTVHDMVEPARELMREYNIERFYCDPSEPEHIEVFNRAGLPAEAANNAVIPGIQEVQRRFVVKGDGRPSLHISPKCANLMSELESYVWHQDETKDKPIKANDHLCDCLRYSCSALNTAPYSPARQSASVYDDLLNQSF
jgi:phage terminase large subunit